MYEEATLGNTRIYLQVYSCKVKYKGIYTYNQYKK